MQNKSMNMFERKRYYYENVVYTDSLQSWWFKLIRMTAQNLKLHGINTNRIFLEAMQVGV